MSRGLCEPVDGVDLLNASKRRGRLFGLICLLVGVGVGSISLMAFSEGEGRFWRWRRAWSSNSFAGPEWCVKVGEEWFDLVWEVNWGEKEV